MAPNIKVSANMATYPPRQKTFTHCINHLLSLPIIDVIRVYLNEYREIPEEFPKSPKIIYVVGGKNIQDSGKYYWATTLKDEYYFTVDDDFIYPETYFVEHIALLQKYQGDIFVTLHGKEMKPYPAFFHDYWHFYPYSQNLEEDKWVNNGGTGVMAFDNSKYTIPIELFQYNGMTDLWISLYCQQYKIPILCRKHAEDELTYMHNEDTLFDRRASLTDKHSKILHIIGKWELHHK
jgi:hypothetical protein